MLQTCVQYAYVDIIVWMKRASEMGREKTLTLTFFHAIFRHNIVSFVMSILHPFFESWRDVCAKCVCVWLYDVAFDGGFRCKLLFVNVHMCRLNEVSYGTQPNQCERFACWWNCVFLLLLLYFIHSALLCTLGRSQIYSFSYSNDMQIAHTANYHFSVEYLPFFFLSFIAYFCSYLNSFCFLLSYLPPPPVGIAYILTIQYEKTATRKLSFRLAWKSNRKS